MSRVSLLRWVSACLLGMGLTGCASFMHNGREAQLQRVAKDWSQVIRASQVIPVYPLTQDMQPGDIFLVQTPVEQQVASYRQRGFLPLDYQLYRMQPDYREFYRNPAVAVPPGRWGMGSLSDQAPRAGFPSYSFEVSSGGGLELALPVSAVATGLNFLGASAARGSISMRDAQTYGLDIESLYGQVRARVAQDADLKGLLASFAPSPPGPWPWSRGHTNYLRVVNRVFLVRSMDVSLQATARHSAGLTAGLQPGLSLGGYDATLRALNRSLLCGQAAPGRAIPDVCRVTAAVPLPAVAGASDVVEGASRLLPDLAAQALASGGVSVQSVSSSGISLREDFKVPVVVGYHGFDIPIGRNGALGAPIPTYSLLNGAAVSDAPLAVLSSAVITRKIVEDSLERLPAEQAALALDAAVRQLGTPWSALWEARAYRSARPLDAWRAVLTSAVRAHLVGSNDEALIMAALSAGCSSQGLSDDCSASR